MSVKLIGVLQASDGNGGASEVFVSWKSETRFAVERYVFNNLCQQVCLSFQFKLSRCYYYYQPLDW